MLKADITDFRLNHYQHYFLFYYIRKQEGNDWISTNFLRFKEDREVVVDAWIDFATSSLKELSLNDNTVIVRALHSHETVIDPASNTPLDRLCRSIADTFHCAYLPGLLFKTRSTQPLHNLPSAKERVAEMTDLYQAGPGMASLENKSILLVDDVVTTGLTVRHIIKAIRTMLPEINITVFSLAKTEYNPDINKTLDLQGAKYKFNGVKWIRL